MSGPKLAIAIVLGSAGVLAAALAAGPGPARLRAAAQEAVSRLGAPDRAPEKTLYQYTDGRGAVRFVPSLDDVPPAQRARAGRVLVPDTAAPSVAAKPAPLASQPRPKAASAPKEGGEELPAWRRFDSVVIYTASWCGYCRSALADLDERGVDYVRKQIDTDIDANAELRDRTGDTSVPQLFADDRHVIGYDARTYDALFGERR